MLFGDFCFMNVNLVKAGLCVGFYDIITICIEIIIDIEVVMKFRTENIIALMIQAVAILVAILLIHGALKLNRFLIIYWMVIAVLRCILHSFIEFQMLLYLPFFTNVGLVAVMISTFDYLILFPRMILVWKLYFAIRQRDQNNFQELSERSRV